MVLILQMKNKHTTKARTVLCPYKFTTSDKPLENSNLQASSISFLKAKGSEVVEWYFHSSVSQTYNIYWSQTIHQV